MWLPKEMLKEPFVKQLIKAGSFKKYIQQTDTYTYEKYIKDGKVAVLYSSGFGAGWYTWNDESLTGLVFDRDIVEAVLAEFDGDVRRAIRALLDDVAALAEDRAGGRNFLKAYGHL
jgi:hypothetical protein